MGVGNIIENNIANGCEQVWKKIPQIPELSLNLSKYDRSFVSFASLVGAYALIKSSIYLTKKSLQFVKDSRVKIPSAQKLQQKYGEQSWALIVDCKGNQNYCILLAQKGFNIILCGQEDDIKIAEDRLFRESGQIDYKLQTVVVNWQEEAKNLKYYEQLDKKLSDFDISIMVMPLIQQGSKSATYNEQESIFQHAYLMVRHFGPKLKWRSNASAIIFPSSQQVDRIDDNQNGVTRAIQSGVDAFGRTLAYQLKNQTEVIIARGTPDNALANLGKKLISH